MYMYILAFSCSGYTLIYLAPPPLYCINCIARPYLYSTSVVISLDTQVLAVCLPRNDGDVRNVRSR